MQTRGTRQRLILAAVIVAGLGLSSAAFADEHVKGVITGRGTDGSLNVETQDGSNIVVVLNDAAKVRRIDGARSMNASSATLTPGLRIEASGDYEGVSRFVALKVTFTRSDLKIARAIEGGVNPTDQRSLANQQKIEQHAQMLQRQAATIAQQEQQLAAQRAQIAANDQKIVATSGALNARISNLDDYNAISSVTVLFPNGKSTIASKYKTQLQQLAAQANGTQAYAIKIQGYASAVGSAALNQQLSLQRSVAVTAVLQQSGVDPLKVVVPAAMGTTEQVASNKTKQGQAENRRAVVTLLQNKGIAGR